MITSEKEGGWHAVVVAGSKPAAASLARQFASLGWEATVVSNCSELDVVLRSRWVHLVCAQSALPDGNWRDVVTLVHRRSRRTEIVVYSSHIDARLWLDVLSFGVADLLPEPCPDMTIGELLKRVSKRKSAENDR